MSFPIRLVIRLLFSPFFCPCLTVMLFYRGREYQYCKVLQRFNNLNIMDDAHLLSHVVCKKNLYD